MSELLLPCPFCGTKDLDYCSYYEMWRVECRNPSCEIEGSLEPSKEKATESWNRRASPWINVEERLPEKDDDCLLVVEIRGNRVVETGYYSKKYGFHISHEDSYHEDDGYKDWDNSFRITYWMPVPEPPSEFAQEALK